MGDPVHRGLGCRDRQPGRGGDHGRHGLGDPPAVAAPSHGERADSNVGVSEAGGQRLTPSFSTMVRSRWAPAFFPSGPDTSTWSVYRPGPFPARFSAIAT